MVVNLRQICQVGAEVVMMSAVERRLSVCSVYQSRLVYQGGGWGGGGL